MARVRFRDFRGGLVPSGPREAIGEGALRRARGVWPVRTPSLRSRGGTALIESPGVAHSFTRFGGKRYYGVGLGVIADGVPILAGLDGNLLNFAAMAPSPGLQDKLYVCGGGVLKKIAPDAVQEWGISPPPDGFVTAMLVPQVVKVIDNCDAFTGWVGSTPIAPETTIKVEGVASLTSVTTLVDNQKYVWSKLGTTWDLNEFSPGANDSPDEDWICLAVRFSRPRMVDSLVLSFGKDGSINNGFTFNIIIDDDVSKKKHKGRKRRGLSDHIAVSNNEVNFAATIPSLPLRISLTELLGENRASPNDNAWAMLRIPKNVFTVVGNATDWSQIVIIQLTVNTNGLGTATDFLFDDIKLVGGVGMQGDYQYLFTYRNPTLNIRSNPNLTPLKIETVQRQGVQLTVDPSMASSDPQVGEIEAWRTFGNGAVFFRDMRIPNAAQVYVDTVADYFGLHSSNPSVLETEVLPLDNIKPLSTLTDVVGPHYGRLFWIDGSTNRVYYSAPGRPESMAGFLEVIGTDDRAQKLVLWNDAVWLLTTKRMFQIVGTTEPFIAFRVPGGVGTRWPRSVVPTDMGIFFRSVDGPRLFDGTRTHRLGVESFGQLYYGEATENLIPLAADDTGKITCATWTGEEYVLTDGVQTWAWSVREEKYVRDFGVGFPLIVYEMETGLLLVCTDGGDVGQLDAPGVVTDLNGAGIPFEIQPPSFLLRTSELALVQRVYVELNSNGQLLVPTLIVDAVELALPPISTTEQQTIELPVTKIGTVFGVRLSGLLTAGPVEIIAIEWDGPNVVAEQEG